MQMAVELARLGAAPYCPHANLGHAFGHIEETTAREVNMAFLGACDAVVLLPGWQKSVGTLEERANALAWDKPVFEGLAAIRTWLGAK